MPASQLRHRRRIVQPFLCWEGHQGAVQHQRITFTAMSSCVLRNGISVFSPLATEYEINAVRLPLDVDPQTDYRCDRAVRRCVLQHIASYQPFPYQLQWSVSHPDLKEDGTRHLWRLFVSFYFKLVGAVEALWTPRCLPAERLLNVRWSSTAAEVRFLS